MVYTPPAQSQQTKKTWKPVAAGILDIICGFSAIGWSLIILFIVYISFQLNPYYSFYSMDLGAVVLVGSIAAAIAILAMAGGIYAIRRKRLRLALGGSIAAFLLCLLPGIISIRILVMISEEQTQISRPQIPGSVATALIAESLPYLLFLFIGITAITLTALSKSEFE